MKSSRSRSRSKNSRNRQPHGGGNVVNRVFDSSGPEGKVRGTPQQVIEKYNQLARDAQLSNDRVAAENFQQHAEHYLRMLSEAQREMDQRREEQERQQRERQEEQERQNRERQAERDRERAERQEREAANGGPSNDGDADTGNQGGTDQSQQHGQDNKDQQPKRRRNNNRNAKQPDLLQGDSAAQGGDDGSTLVETPENKPKPRRAPRRKPQAKPDDASGPISDGGDHNEAAE
ncbi:protein of unknown function [Sulfitobacter marinus]|uniref:DUF4167 domain-containing protein n=1 Tax=Sulfitobacter marinus TaxID=394264 RepID=A0A1I6QPC3_9RHOB|nr:DUF4167 domain-containing protein [Sulfitobacter marinus]SFS54275.1 protein of unknown function [Sulfitobacter marinus]